MGKQKEILLEMRNITKRFANVTANDDVSLTVYKGEIHALLGENGAGKSTLMNILYGLMKRDAGRVLFKGREISLHSPAQAIEAGIGMIHQHFQLVDKFTVLENIILGLREGRHIELPLERAEKKIAALCESYGLDIKIRALVENLPVGEQQKVEIVKALYRDSEILIMDEPTAVLTPQEVRKLFVTLNRLREEGKSIIFISHKLPEVLEISDRISIMRDGRMVDTIDNTPDLNSRQLATHMVGREIKLQVEKKPCCPGEVVLSLDHTFADAAGESCGIKDISFELRRGEILGIAGVDGNGQEDLSEMIMGLRKLTKGKICILGEDVSNSSTKKIRGMSIGYIPADRLHAALVLDFTLKLNLALNHPDKPPYGNRFLMNFKNISRIAKEKLKQFNVAAPDCAELARNLSGGNQQKVVLAREVGEKTDLIIAVYPTRGLDIDATRFVFDTLLKERDGGAAILYISTELEEILTLSDRIGVLYEGVLMDVFPAENAEVEKIGLLMAGERV
ncbi:MAG: ABC transporter ATP-binding protein [Clostridiales Family XIII bacterium]|nr:ABC transporter ATP-binding protein [Clostridiales Family XIII bacterium]